jgi:hypothetical protein
MCPRALAATQALGPEPEREWCDLAPDMLAVASTEGYLTRPRRALGPERAVRSRLRGDRRAGEAGAAVATALDAGAMCYVRKGTTRAALVQTIRAAIQAHGAPAAGPGSM